jgi:hypothetical protein
MWGRECEFFCAVFIFGFEGYEKLVLRSEGQGVVRGYIAV